MHQRISDIIQKTRMLSTVSKMAKPNILSPREIAASSSERAKPTRPSGPTTFAQNLNELIHQEAYKQQVSPQLIKAIVQVESSGRTYARSPKGALGLMQLMPATARKLGVDDPLHPRQNLAGGIRYLKEMAYQFGDLDLALAAYNAGPQNVRKYKGVPPYQETQKYIEKVRRYL